MRYLHSIFFILISNISVTAQSFNWVFHAGDHINDYTTAMATDNFGNTYIAGVAADGSFGNIQMPFLGYYLAKLDSTGSIVWTRHIDNQYVQTQEILIDTNGDIIVAGYFSNDINHQGFYVNNQFAAIGSSFVMKYNANGSLIWGKAFHPGPTGGKTTTWAATLDSNNDIYLAGFTNIYVRENNSPITPSVVGKKDMFILKLNSSGNTVWAKLGGGTEDDEAVDIAFYNNHLYVLGNVQSSTMQFDTVTANLASAGVAKPILVKYSLDGDVESVKTLADVDVIQERIEISSSGSIYTLGRVFGTVIFYPNDTIQASSIGDGYIARHDLEGSCLWVRKIGAEYNPSKWTNRDFITDANDNIYIVNNFYQNFTTETFSLSATGPGYLSDIYIAKYNEIGYPQWAQSGGSTEFDYGGNIRFDYQNRLVVSGHYQGLSATFGGITFPNNSGNNNADFFVTSVNNILPDTCPVITLPVIAPKTSFCEGDSVELKINNNPYAIFLQWYKDGVPIPEATDNRIYAKEAGIYTVGINENTACLLSSTDVQLTELLYPTLELPEDTIICPEDMIDVTAITNAPTISWSNGDTTTTTTLLANEIGIATVSLNGCELSDTVIAGPRLFPDIQLTKNEISTLTASGGIFYEWYFEDSLILSGTDSIFQALEYGTYQVTGYDEFECKKTVSIDIDFTNCQEIMIYPNPSNGVFTIRAIPEKIESIIIYNTIGQIVYQHNEPLSSKELLNLEAELSGGIYFMSVKTANDCTVMQKIIIRK